MPWLLQAMAVHRSPSPEEAPGNAVVAQHEFDSERPVVLRTEPRLSPRVPWKHRQSCRSTSALLCHGAIQALVLMCSDLFYSRLNTKNQWRPRADWFV